MKALVKCPHCDETMYLNVTVDEVPEGMRKGPKPYDPGPEVDSFVIRAIERQRLSFSTVAALLEERGVLTAKGRTRWYPASVKRLYEQAVKREESGKDA